MVAYIMYIMYTVFFEKDEHVPYNFYKTQNGNGECIKDTQPDQRAKQQQEVTDWSLAQRENLTAAGRLQLASQK